MGRGFGLHLFYIALRHSGSASYAWLIAGCRSLLPENLLVGSVEAGYGIVSVCCLASIEHVS